MRGKKYRIIQALGPDTVLLIELGVDKYHFERVNVNDLYSIAGIIEESPHNTGAKQITGEEMDLIKEKMRAIQAVLDGMSDFSQLAARRTTAGIDAYMQKYGCTRCTAHKSIRRYLQSGMDMYSLRDGRHTAEWDSGDMFSGKRGGGHSFNDGRKRVAIDPEKERSYFEEGFKMIKRETSLTCILNALNRKYFSDVILDENGNFIDIIPLPINECLSEKRFRRYVRTQIGALSLESYKAGIRKRRNDERIQFGTAQTGCTHPGAVVEIDACELDLIVVGQNYRQDLGRPVVYFAIDVYSARIIGFTVGFENNSFLGATSLLNNLFFSFGIIPKSIRVDHGAEWVSKDLRRLGRELGIDIEIVAPGTGSMKGLVESSFHSYQKTLRNLGRRYGAIYKEYESRHYEMASLMLNEIDLDIGRFIETHNRSLLKKYELPLEMIQDKVRAIPVEIWDYGIKFAASPRIVTEAIKNMILFALCVPRPVRTGHSLTQKGFTLKGLTYISKDRRITELIMRKKYNTGPEEYEVRIDPRTVGHIWVRIGCEFIKVPLGEKHDNLMSFAQFTWHEYEMICNDKKTDEDAYKEEDRHQKYWREEATQRMMEDSKKRQTRALEDRNSKKDIRPAREKAQQDERRSNVLGGSTVAEQESFPEPLDKLPPSMPEDDDFESRFEDYYY